MRGVSFSTSECREPAELDLQKSLVQNGVARPIIFLTAHGDIPMSVQAMKAGAIDFLIKPVRDQALLDAIVAGIAVDAARRREAEIVNENVERFKRLTPRERQVLKKSSGGRVNKQVAFELGISEVTVKLHRANIMRKLEATSIGTRFASGLVAPGYTDTTR